MDQTQTASREGKNGEAGGEQGAGLGSVTTFTKRRKALNRVNGSETPWYSQRPGVDQGRPGLVFTA